MARDCFRVLFAVPAVALALAGCDIKVNDGGGVSLGVSRGRASDDWVRSYTLAKGGRFEMANENGEILVTGTRGADVKVVAHRQVSARSDEEARDRLENLKMREDVSADRVFVEAQAGGGLQDMGFARGVGIRWEIEVPDGLTLAFKTMNGTIRLDGVDGRITAATTNGNVSGNGITGSVQGSSVNGSVAMNFDAVSGDVQLTTVNGALRMEVPPRADIDLHATTVNGRVSVDETLGLADVLGSRSGFGPTTNVRGRLNQGTHRVTLQTTNGGVRVSARGSGGEDGEPGERRDRRGRGERPF